MIYVLNKDRFKFLGRFDNMKFAKAALEKAGIQEENCIFTEEICMRYVSRIVEVDGKIVYMNKDWWTKEAPAILNDYNNHKVYDFIEVSKPIEERKTVSKDRFKREFNQNIDRINAIDGVAGEVNYNISVGNDFISLFREECIFTDFQEVTPLEIAQKLLTVISLVQTGSFREAKLVLKQVKPDAFLTKERLKKYEDMLDAADAITYATKEDYFYSAP